MQPEVIAQEAKGNPCALSPDVFPSSQHVYYTKRNVWIKKKIVHSAGDIPTVQKLISKFFISLSLILKAELSHGVPLCKGGAVRVIRHLFSQRLLLISI